MVQVQAAAGGAEWARGPVYGIRVLDFGLGAWVSFNNGDRLPVVACFPLPAPLGRPWDRVDFGGPVTAQVAQDIGEDLTGPVSPRAWGALDGDALRVASKGRLLFDSGNVAAGAAIATPVIDLTPFSSVRVVAYNADAVAARSLTFTEYAADLATMIAVSTTIGSVTTTSYLRFGFAALATATASAVAGVPLAASFALAAAGTSIGRLVVIGR